MLEVVITDIGQTGFDLVGRADVPAGITAIMGPSGAGKSTLLSVIAGFVSPKVGTVLWGGASIADLAPGKRPVSILFQDNNLFPHLSILQNAVLAFGSNPKMDRATPLALAALARVGLQGYAGRNPGQLSGGQQSRAALARILLQDRPVVLLDEPFAALGPALKSEMLALVAETLVGKTVLMVTHDPNDARAIADRILVVADGRFSDPAPMADILNNPPAALAAYLGNHQSKT